MEVDLTSTTILKGHWEIKGLLFFTFPIIERYYGSVVTFKLAAMTSPFSGDTAEGFVVT